MEAQGSSTVNMSSGDQNLSPYQLNDLLEPQYYPDPVIFRSSLELMTKDDNELKKNLISNKATLRVLAPYLKIIHKDQKRMIDTARSHRSPRVKETKYLFDKKSKEQLISSIPDLAERFEMIFSIHETADVLKTLLKATTVVSYIVNPNKNELYQSPRNVASSPLNLTWKIEPDTTMAAYTAHTKQYSVTNNVLTDSRFPMGLGFPGTMVKYAMCVPIKTPDDKVVAVYEFSREALDLPFDKRDLQIVLAVTGWMGVAILQNTLYLSLVRQHELNSYLLQLTNHYHSGQSTVDKTLTDVVVFARETVVAERCNLYIVEKEVRGALIVDEYDQGAENSQQLYRRRTKKYVELDSSMLSRVMMNKEVVNEQFNVGGFKLDGETEVRSILSVPIKCENIILGAILLSNKKYLNGFTKEDENILHTFASFCTLNINHLKLHDNLKKVQLQTNIIQEMLSHHIRPCVHDQEAVKNISQELPDQFFTFAWYPAPDEMPRLVELTINMFHEVLGDSFMLLNDVPKFILTVRNCYRPNRYHNFLHAFGVTHTMANMVNRYHRIFTGIERKGLMVACLCHDVDHRGYTNNFVQLTKHYLATLYDSSPLENHHFAVAKMIIEQCGLFKYIKPEIYNELLTEIYECIIATDLSLYFQSRMELMRTADEKSFTFKNPTHRRLVKNVMMTACDLSGQTKALPICTRITEDCYEEFFQQGDTEKKMGFIPLPTMDRDKKYMIPENQVQFLSVVVLPCVEIVSRIFSNLSPMLWDTKTLLQQWKELIQIKDQETWKPDESVASGV